MSRHVYLATGLGIAWLVMLVSPATVMPLGWAAYGSFLLLIGWSAINVQNPGWESGAFFVLLSATIPLWVLGMMWVFCVLTGSTWP